MDKIQKHDGRCKLVFSFVIYMLLLIFFPFGAYGQISYGGNPAGLDKKSTAEIPVMIMPEFDPQRYLDKEMINMDQRLKPLIFAKAFPLHIDPLKDGSWKIVNDGTRVWQIALQSKGAFSLNIIFSSFRLEPGVSVFLYNNERSHILGSFNHRNNQVSGSLATAPVKGDMIIVEMQVDKENQSFGELVIGSLNHDFKGITGSREGRFGLSGKCNIDTACPSGDKWQTHKNSVVRVTINGTIYCTGVLVNNTSNDGKPYLLTANHCIDDDLKADQTIFLFGFESPYCNGEAGQATNSLSGSDLVATQENLDFTLVQIRDMPPPSYRPWYAGWERSGATPDNTVSIHHPQGDVKKIAKDSDSPLISTFGTGYTQNGHWRIERWDLGTTENGSSGSPLFDQDGKLKGLLTGGAAICGNAIDDYYCRFSLAWDNYDDDISDHLKPWLDPFNTGAVSLQGMNPYADNELSADFEYSTTEVCVGDKVVFTDFSTGDIESWYWDFGQDADPADAFTRGPHMVEYPSGGERNVSLTVTGINGSDNMDKVFDLIVKTTDLPVADFSYVTDNLTVEFQDLSENAESYYWEFGDTRISTRANPANSYSSEGEYTVRQLVHNRACADTSIQLIEVSILNSSFRETPEEIKIYPVPADNYLIIETGPTFLEESYAELFSVTGQGLFKKRIPKGQQNTTLDLDRYPPGIYILKVSSGKEFITKKITISR